jgi:hypothetical protein
MKLHFWLPGAPQPSGRMGISSTQLYWTKNCFADKMGEIGEHDGWNRWTRLISKMMVLGWKEVSRQSIYLLKVVKMLII